MGIKQGVLIVPCSVSKTPILADVLDDDFNTSKQERKLIHIANPGVGCVTYPYIIRENKRIGGRIGIHEINSQIPFLKIKNNIVLKELNSLKTWPQ